MVSCHLYGIETIVQQACHMIHWHVVNSSINAPQARHM